MKLQELEHSLLTPDFLFMMGWGLLPESNVIPHGEEAWQVILFIKFQIMWDL